MSGWVFPMACLAVFFMLVGLILVSNLRELKPLQGYSHPMEEPLVSILVPARDEERSLEVCLRSLLAQDYRNFELCVLDDRSQDGTATVITRLSRENLHLIGISGTELPTGWIGKHWACQQLIDKARGDLLYFTDADTVHHPQALSNMVAALQWERADMLTSLPKEIVQTWGERLTVPLIGWSLLCFQPLFLIHRTRLPAISVAIGQSMLFRRHALERIGGFSSVRRDTVDDLALARNIKNAGLRLHVCDGTDRISCRMYSNFREAQSGFSKNLFAAFRYNLPLFLFVWCFLVYASWSPWILLGVSLFFPLPLTVIAWSTIAALVPIPLWLLALWRLHIPPFLALASPLMMVLALTIALRSVVLTYSGRASWKGRTLDIDHSR
jgi:chlorobactene glucosyltransferase